MAFDLSSIRNSADNELPARIVIYGIPGIGKSSFGAEAPGGIFLPTEDGCAALGVDMFPVITSWSNNSGTGLTDALELLANSQHSYQNVILDSADWTENIIKEQVARDHKLDAYDTNAKALSFGRGGRAVEEYWRKITGTFDYLRETKKMGSIIIAHSQVKRFDDPTTESYDRYILDLLKESSSVLIEWADIVVFANKKTNVIEEKVGINGVKKRGVGSDEHWMYTSETPAFKAKSRWSIPRQMPLSYTILMQEVAAAKARLKEARAGVQPTAAA